MLSKRGEGTGFLSLNRILRQEPRHALTMRKDSLDRLTPESHASLPELLCPFLAQQLVCPNHSDDSRYSAPNP